MGGLTPLATMMSSCRIILSLLMITLLSVVLATPTNTIVEETAPETALDADSKGLDITTNAAPGSINDVSNENVQGTTTTTTKKSSSGKLAAPALVTIAAIAVITQFALN